MLSLASCNGGVEKIFNAGGVNAELYYDSYADVRNRIKREDVKRGDLYSDLFLADGVEMGMDISKVLNLDPRKAMLDISSVKEVFFVPNAGGNTRLTDWINQSTIKYTFNQDQLIHTYEIRNSKSNNTYTEYLYVMRALSLKYGECTTEIYKDEDNIINNTKIRQDYKEIKDVVDFYEREFSAGNVGIISQWVMDEFVLTVDFKSPENCSVTYELIKRFDPGSDKDDE